MNDDFGIQGLFIEQFHMVIYDRWGNVVFETHSLEDRWIGISSEGEACPEGVYVYVANGMGYDGGKLKRVGSVTLIR